MPQESINSMRHKLVPLRTFFHDGVREMTAGCVHGHDATRLPRDQQQTSYQESEQASGFEPREKPELEPEFHPGGQGGDGVFFGVVDDEGFGKGEEGGKEGGRGCEREGIEDGVAQDGRAMEHG